MQFECRKTYGKVAQGRVGPTKVLQVHVLEVTSHARALATVWRARCRIRSRPPSKAVSALPETRGHVLLLAQLYPKPLKDAANKSGMWSASRIIYGHYSDRVLEGCASQDFQKFNCSMKFRFRMAQLGAIAGPSMGARCPQGLLRIFERRAPKFDFAPPVNYPLRPLQT